MPATQEDRLYGLTTSVAVKPAVAISADYNITLFGEQTITSSTFTGERTTTTTAGMRVLAMGQANPADNGIWIASVATWARAPDFDGARDAMNGTLVFSIYGDCWQLEADDPVRIGYSDLVFRSTYPFSGEANLFQRSLRVPETSISILPQIDDRKNKILAFDELGSPIAVVPESGSAADVLIQLAKPSGAGLVGSESGTVQQVLNGKLKTSNHLSEIAQEGASAVSETLLNLGLGDVVRYGTFGTLPSGAMTVLPGGDFNLAPSGWCAASAATVNAPYNPINGTVFTWGSAGASSTGLLVPPSVGVAGQKWYQVLFDEAQAIYTRQRIGTGAWTDWQQIAHPKYFFVYPDGTSASPYVYPVNTRKEYTNPFPGKYLNVVAEVQVSGIWGAVPYVFAESSLQGIGIQATQINGNGNIVVQSGTNKVAFRSLYQGNPFGITADVGASPFRLKISNVGDL
ncbi:TPA: hypothetical protein ACPZUF_002429 [Yersinia enterocolitica]